MIDLSLQNKRQLYELKWLDGTVIRLKAPTQRLYKSLMNLQENQDIDSIYEICGQIVNNNTSLRKLDASELSVDMCSLVLTDYLTYWTNELDKVVFQESQQMNQ